jgi:multisubunit Na+/H+ antiporter MnhE subunit
MTRCLLVISLLICWLLSVSSFRRLYCFLGYSFIAVLVASYHHPFLSPSSSRIVIGFVNIDAAERDQSIPACVLVLADEAASFTSSS